MPLPIRILTTDAAEEIRALSARIAELELQLSKESHSLEIWVRWAMKAFDDIGDLYDERRALTKRAVLAEAELLEAQKAIDAQVKLLAEADTRADRQSKRADSYARTAQACLRDAGPALVEAREQRDEALEQLEAARSAAFREGIERGKLERGLAEIKKRHSDK